MSDPVFLLSVVTIFSGIVGLCIRYAFRSKCSNINCCFGLCQVQRDIQREIELEQKQIAERAAQHLNAERTDSGVQSPRSRVAFSEE
jgi:hypothetical protein